MKKDLMKTNCYDTNNIMVIVGSCLEKMQPEAYKKLTQYSNIIYEVCLEATHVNMVISKIMGMICRSNINKIIFATVDKSPHCIQLHYIENELRKAMKIDNIKIIHYVAVDNNLIEISNETIKKSKSLSELEKHNKCLT